MVRFPVAMEPTPPSGTEGAAYVLEGIVAHVTDGLGPVRARDETGRSLAVVVWHCSAGEVAGVDVSGLTVVAVGRRDAESDRRVLFLDEDAEPQQVAAIVDLAWGRLGIAWAGLISAADYVGAFQVPIHFAEGGVTVKDRLWLALGTQSAEQWMRIPELDVPWRSVHRPPATARFRVEG